jgi:glutathione synthase/RimK-type ligase-like ATP-grasp enzyme
LNHTSCTISKRKSKLNKRKQLDSTILSKIGTITRNWNPSTVEEFDSVRKMKNELYWFWLLAKNRNPRERERETVRLRKNWFIRFFFHRTFEFNVVNSDEAIAGSSKFWNFWVKKPSKS